MILTICIPTYNRVAFLETLVNFIISEIERNKLEREIEILISNNGSTDGTSEFLNKLKIMHSSINLKVMCNAENIGVVRNMISCVNNASGDFWWFIGDDDLVVKDVLPRIVDHLQVNRSIPVHVFNQKHYKPIVNSESINIETAIRKYFYYMGNAITIANTLLSKEITNKEMAETVSTCWPHTYIYFRICFQSGLPKPLFVSTLPIFYQQPRVSNNVTNAFYHFDSQFFSLFKLGYLIEAKSSRSLNISKLLLHGIDFVRFPRILSFAFDLEFKKRFSDLENEKNDYQSTLEEAKLTLKQDHQYLLQIILSYKHLPDFFFINYILIKNVVYLVLYNLLKKNRLLNPAAIFRKERLRIDSLREIKQKQLKLKYAHHVVKGGW
jgi:glycosyltransferase involved in cell wall biosynthesis